MTTASSRCRVRGRETCSPSSCRALPRFPSSASTTGKIAGSPVTVSRTGYSGDLGYEIWVQSPDALKVWDVLWDSIAGYGVLPFGLAALDMLRIEAGLLLLDVDFASSRFGWTDEDRSSLIELGWGWMFRDLAADGRPFIGRRAIERELAERTSRWRLTGLMVDWADYDRIYGEAGLIPPKDHKPVLGEMFLYDDDMHQVGYTTSFMYSPMLQRHIALARVRPEIAAARTPVRLEMDVNHRYEYVSARTAPAALQPTEKDGLTCRRHRSQRSGQRNRRRPAARTGPTTRSSSGAATTAWSMAPTSPRPVSGP